MHSIPTRSALLSQLGTIIRQNLNASGNGAMVDHHEQERADEHWARDAFVPHIHAIHERRIPAHQFWELMAHICTSQDYYRIMRGPFGRATTLLFRDTYDHTYVYDVNTQGFIGEHHGAYDHFRREHREALSGV